MCYLSTYLPIYKQIYKFSKQTISCIPEKHGKTHVFLNVRNILSVIIFYLWNILSIIMLSPFLNKGLNVMLSPNILSLGLSLYFQLYNQVIQFMTPDLIQLEVTDLQPTFDFEFLEPSFGPLEETT